MDLDQVLRPLQLKDLRVLLRQRGCSPAGGQDELRSRLKENMIATGNYSVALDGANQAPVQAGASTADMKSGSLMNNYSRPGGMQNVGNFLTDKPSSRVLAPPGGGSQIMFGDYQDPYTQKGAARPQQQAGQQQISAAYQQAPPAYQQAPPNYQQSPYQQAPPPGYQQTTAQYGSPMPGGGSPGYGSAAGQVLYGAASSDVSQGSLSNNYARPGGQQNVGNFLTDRPSSRVLAPPGGKSQISFG